MATPKMATPDTPPAKLMKQPSTIQRLVSGMEELQAVANQLYAEPESSAEGQLQPPQQEATTAAVVVEAVAVTAAKAAESPAPSVRAKEPAWLQLARRHIDKPLTPGQQIMQDKIVHVLGLANLMLTAFLFAFPRAFIALFVVKSIVLLSARWLVYRLKNWHYYLLEYCYVVISLGIVQCTLFPSSPSLHKLVFSLMAGVLTPAVIATRNAFVLHSVDKITSLFQHLTPALVAWLLRWQTHLVVPGWHKLSEAQQAAFSTASLSDLLLLPMLVWLLWASVYYVIVFVIAEKKVRERGYATMFALQTKNPKSPTSKFIFSFKDRYQQYAAYLAVHGACCFAGTLLNALWFNSCILHTAYVLAVLGVSMWNGASYTFHVFAQRYTQSIGAMEPKTDKPADKEA